MTKKLSTKEQIDLHNLTFTYIIKYLENQLNILGNSGSCGDGNFDRHSRNLEMEEIRKTINVLKKHDRF